MGAITAKAVTTIMYHCAHCTASQTALEVTSDMVND